MKKIEILVWLIVAVVLNSCTKREFRIHALEVRVQKPVAKPIRSILVDGMVEPASGRKVLSPVSGKFTALRSGGEKISSGEQIGRIISGGKLIGVHSNGDGLLWNLHANAEVVRGDRLATIHPAGKYRVRLNMPTALPNSMPSRQSVRISLPLIGGGIVSGALQKEKDGWFAYFNFPPRIAESLSARVELSPGRYSLYSLPRDSITSPDGTRKFIYVMRSGKSVRIPVEPYSFSGDQTVLVHASLEKEDQIIIYPVSRLVNNQTVEVVP